MKTTIKTILLSICFVSCASHVETDNGKISPQKIQMAITFDDLPSHSAPPYNGTYADTAKRIIRTLKTHSVPEVYGFVNGQKIDEQPNTGEILKLWVDAGYPLGNHTYSHPNLNAKTAAEYIMDIDQNEKFLQQYSSMPNWKFFRYPYLSEGNTMEKRQAVRDHLKSKGYQIAQVTMDFKDWAWNDAYGRCSARNDVNQLQWLRESYLKNAKDEFEFEKQVSQKVFHRQIPYILLMHIGAFDAVMLDELLKYYESQGVQFISLTQALKDKVYSTDPKIAVAWGAVYTYQIMKSKGLEYSDLGIEPGEEYPEQDLNISCQY